MAGETLSRSNFADDFETARQIDGAHGIAVANRARERWRIAVRSDVHSQYTPGSFDEPDIFYGR
jgi:hypothetical protein